MTIYVNAGSLAQNFATTMATFGNTIATAQANAALCGTTYTQAVSPTNAIWTFSGSTFTATSTSFSEIGIYTITVSAKLAPYDLQDFTFVLTVTCNMTAPVFSASSFTVDYCWEQPYTIPFTQPNSCGKTATKSNPGAWLTMPSSTTTGGSLLVSGATLLNLGTFTVTLTNAGTAPLVTQTVTITIIIRDPCASAVF
jgi:hypothetical protein